MKGFNRKISDVYVQPLPIVTKSLPPLIPYNPISVLIYIYHLFIKKDPKQDYYSGVIINSQTHVKDDGLMLPEGVRIDDPYSITALWQKGFFGKGTLSRSEPSWFGRTSRRLGFDGGDLTLEEITEMRRAKRRQFKREREIQQQIELVERLKNEGKHNFIYNTVTKTEEENNEISIRDEDRQIVHGETIMRLEYLHLHPCEAIFLSFGLDVLSFSNIGNKLDALPMFFQNLTQWNEYIAYHYFRSLGYCARSGVKFGVDWLIYRRGPPFHHAEFAVIIMNDTRKTWSWLHSNMRVVGGAKKTLCLLYVQGPQSLPEFSKIKTIKDFRTELSKNKVKIISYSRFTPAKNRD